MKSLVFPRIFLHCVALGFIVSGLLLSEGSEVQILPETLKRSISDNMILSDIDLFMIDIYLLKIKEILSKTFFGILSLLTEAHTFLFR